MQGLLKWWNKVLFKNDNGHKGRTAMTDDHVSGSSSDPNPIPTLPQSSATPGPIPTPGHVPTPTPMPTPGPVPLQKASIPPKSPAGSELTPSKALSNNNDLDDVSAIKKGKKKIPNGWAWGKTTHCII
ncbi:hypothetical protein BDR04DRAFT_1119110 [Suillus decipiens]|nr:hypothetical protein BDR04DRAFT_1119110 [Suillus decipiens]